MKLVHDLEHDLAHTIPAEGGPDSRWLFREMTVRALALVAPQAHERVLDLACGMGQDSAALAAMQVGAPGCIADAAAEPLAAADAGRMRGGVWGVEPSARMLGWARSHAFAPAAGRLSWTQALAEELPFPNASFDAVLCKGALDHFISPALALGEAARVLRPGGRLVLALANYDALSCRLGHSLTKLGLLHPSRADGHAWFEPPPDHLTRFGYREIRALTRQADGAAADGAGDWASTRISGVSLLWGFPPWSRLLGRLPARAAQVLAGGMGALGAWVPPLADVVLLLARRA